MPYTNISHQNDCDNSQQDIVSLEEMNIAALFYGI